MTLKPTPRDTDGMLAAGAYAKSDRTDANIQRFVVTNQIIGDQSNVGHGGVLRCIAQWTIATRCMPAVNARLCQTQVAQLLYTTMDVEVSRGQLEHIAATV